MNTKRQMLLIALVVASLSVAVGTGSFTSVSADRGIDVTVADDENAYLGIGDELQCGVGEGQGENKNFIRNQFAQTTLDHVTVELSVPATADGSLRVRAHRTDGGGPDQDFVELDPGEATNVTYTLGPGEGATLQVQPPTGTATAANSLTVEIVVATGDGITITADEREFDVDCPSN